MCVCVTETSRKLAKRLHNNSSPVLHRGVRVRNIWQRRRARVGKGKTVITKIRFRCDDTPNGGTSAAVNNYASIDVEIEIPEDGGHSFEKGKLNVAFVGEAMAAGEEKKRDVTMRGQTVSWHRFGCCSAFANLNLKHKMQLTTDKNENSINCSSDNKDVNMTDLTTIYRVTLLRLKLCDMQLLF